MSELLRFDTRGGSWLLVEVDDDSPGVESVARDANGVVTASTRLEEAVSQIRPAIQTVLTTLRELTPDQCDIEFGIKLTAEAGVVVAKSAVEGHFTVKLGWRSDSGQGQG